ncbi:MAG: class C beta-lactamase-related serine hydrolase [Caulobacteraceae bacterium]|nr:MAG: class C beta-lactamase-related serine hydrolase [Caulobacteraceae bacterium]
MTSTDETGADLSNWRDSPFNRWAFRNIDALMPTAPIWAGSAWDLPEADPGALDGFALKAGGQTLSLETVLAATATDGMVVLKDGRLVFETYANGLGAHDRHILMSATKSVVGLLVGVLVEQKVLDVAARVTDYLPEMKDGPYAGATLRQLLDMRTGVRLTVEQQHAYGLASGWERLAPGETTQGLQAFLAGLQGPPGEHGGPFAYVSANTDLMGWIIERASGRAFSDLASELLWTPAGAEDDGAITLDVAGAPRTTGGICATVRDFARLGQRIVEGDPMVPPGWVEDIATGGDTEAWRQGEFARAFGGMTMRYRSGWYVIDDAPQVLFAMGIHGQNLFVDRANRIVVAKVSSLHDAIDGRAIGLNHMMFNEVRRMLLS